MFKAKLVRKDRKCLHVFLRAGQARSTVFKRQFYIEKPLLGTIHKLRTVFPHIVSAETIIF